MELNKAIKLAKSFLGEEYFNKLNIDYYKDNKSLGLKVTKNNNDITIVYKSLSELFRGLSLIKEKSKLKSYDITLKPSFDSNGLMIDCSRNGVVRIEELKKIILIEALMGHNRLLLYTEDTYELDGYPYFGYLRGSYSKKDLKEIVEYGESFGVELIPCIQTLGHLEKALRWDVFNDIKESENHLLVNNKKTYDFIESMIKVSRECFKSKDIHIGMDECFQLGLGKIINKYGYQDRVKLFCDHLSKVIKICKKYNFNPLIWSDMFFRLNDKTCEYYSGNKLPESTLKLIPKDVSLVYWDYYHDDIKVYDKMFKSHLDTKREIYFAGGAWRWGGFAPALHKSYEFNKPALESAKKNNVKNVFVTSWGDNGNEGSIYTCLLSLAQYSVINYQDKYNEEDINSLLKAVTGETINSQLSLDLPNMPDNKVLAAPYNPSKFLFYQDPLLGIFDKQVKPNFAKNYLIFSKKLKELSIKSPNYSYVYLNLSNLCYFLNLKVDLGINLRKAYKKHDLKTLKLIANNIIPESIKRLDVFHDSLFTQWRIENRNFGFDVLDGRIGYLRQRLISTSKLVNEYLNKKINKIEELEKDILPYNGYDYEICWNNWFSNVALSS